MKKILLALIASLLFVVPALASPVDEATVSYGAAGIANVTDGELTLSSMLIFALEDEYLARGEYQKVIDKFGERRPFSNIIRAEAQHIAWLVPLFEKYGVVLPLDRGTELSQSPDNLTEALTVGMNAEVANIEMYERFLRKEMPADVKAVFEHLLAASRNHLAAFQGGRGGRK